MTTDIPQELQPCFVITPIGKEGSENRERSDQVLKHIIRPALNPLGYDAQRSNDSDEPGMITPNLVRRVIEDPLVVADLTGLNANVVYEVALRHVTRKPIVHLMEKGNSLPFNISDERAVFYELSLDGADNARAEMTALANSMKANPICESPISLALDLQQYRSTDDPTTQALATLTSEVAALGKRQPSADKLQLAMDRMADFMDQARDATIQAIDATASQGLRRFIEIVYEILTPEQVNALKAQSITQIPETWKEQLSAGFSKHRIRWPSAPPEPRPSTPPPDGPI